MATATKKSFKSAFSEAYPYGAKAIFAVFTEFKSLFKVQESFKRKGVLYELYEYWTEGPCYAVILIDGKKVHYFESGYVRGRLIDTWQKLVGFKLDQYINGCPHYTMDNASEVEIIKSDTRFLEFHKVAKRTMNGSPIKAKYDKIEGTPFMIGRPVMYNTKDGKNNFFYANGYTVLSYDLEYNLKNNHRFNTKFAEVSSIGEPTYTKALDGLIKSLESDLKNYTQGYWGRAEEGGMEFKQPDLSLAKKCTSIIEAVKNFQKTYKGQ